MLIHDRFYDEGSDNYDNFHNITKQLSKRQRVEFAFHCAKDVFHLVNEQDKEVVKLCIDLVEKWLKDEKSVTSEELRNAGNAYYPSAADAHVARDTAFAAASVARWAAVYIANAAAYAVRAWTNTNNKLNEYLVIVNSYFTKTTINCPNYEIEGKILYLIDELDENIVIVHKDKYYINMNGIERCPEYGFDTQQELLNELLNSKCLFWVFARDWLDRLYKNQQA